MIFSVVESPAQKDLIWAGSDDGLIHLTKDGGAHWDNVTPKAMPEWGTVSMIEVSPTDPGTAYAAVERHKMDDFAPYIFKTSDFGKTWSAIANGLQRLHARKPPKSASRTVPKKTTFSGFGLRARHDGRQKMPVVRTPRKKMPS